MSALSRLLTLRFLFTYAVPLLFIAYGYLYYRHVQTQSALPKAASWQFLGMLLVNGIGLILAIRWKNNYLGSVYIAFLLLMLGWGLLLSIGEGASQGLKT
jgi:hypothetical protein